jgi:hypothetical protein
LPEPEKRNIYTKPTEIIKIEIKEQEYSVLVFCVLSKINPRDANEAVNIAKRGYVMQGNLTASLNLQLTDDTDTIFCHINRFRYADLGQTIIDRGGVGKEMYAVKGKVVSGSFRMISAESIRYIGNIND